MKKLCRFIFSRYFVSAIMIALSVALILVIIFEASIYSAYAYLAIVIMNVIAIISLINKETDPEFKIPWIIIMVMIPLFGAAIYAMFYSRRLSKKEAKLMSKMVEESERASKASEATNAMLQGNLDSLKYVNRAAYGKARSIMKDDVVANVYRDSKTKYFPLGEEMFAAMLSDLKAAKKYIFLEYFIVEQGEMWGKIFAILSDKAKAGLDVRLLYDDIGCMHTLPSDFPDKLAASGIRCQRAGKIRPKISTVHHNRDHRKICIVDGRIAYTGGINIADEYINRISRFGHWKDGGVRVEGHAVVGFIKMFLTMWDFTVGTVSNYSDYFLPVRLDDGGDGGYYIPMASGPAPTYLRHTGENAFLNLINQAKEYVYITTPYLIVSYALSEAIKGAARRGVEVVIITPGKADKKLVNVMTKSFYPSFIEAGVKIYEYTPGFMHEKTFVSDDYFAVVGTVNFDYRSFVHHFEDALWMYRSPTVRVIKSSFLKTISVSHKIDREEAKLKLPQKLAKYIIRIFAPLL